MEMSWAFSQNSIVGQQNHLMDIKRANKPGRGKQKVEQRKHVGSANWHKKNSRFTRLDKNRKEICLAIYLSRFKIMMVMG